MQFPVSFFNSLDPDVRAFVAASGATDIEKIKQLVGYVKSQGLWANVRCYPMKSAQNAGSGSVVYGLGGLNAVNLSIINSMPWASTGFLYNGTTHYMQFNWAGFRELGNVTCFCRMIASANSAADTATLGLNLAFGNVGSAGGGFPANRAWNFGGSSTGALALENWTFALENATSSNGRLGSTQASQTWTTGEDLLHTLETLTTGTRLWKNATQITINLALQINTGSNATPAQCGYSTDDLVFLNAARVAGSIIIVSQVRRDVALMIVSGTLTDTQRTTLQGLINAL